MALSFMHIIPSVMISGSVLLLLSVLELATTVTEYVASISPVTVALVSVASTTACTGSPPCRGAAMIV